MKRRRIFVTALLTVFISVFLLACGKTEVTDDGIVGRWSHVTDGGNEQIYVFESDGTIKLETSLGDAKGTYEIKGDTISYTMVMPNGIEKSDSMTYKLNGDSIDLTKNGKTYNYVKK
ncbi:MAG: hypothetical protein J5525_01690 [Lachnospiraceae bacterium]|nr:hypothetical protein [Lachnospiraceae bacterium]